MKKLIIPFLFLLICLACNDQPGYKITGTVNNGDLDGKYVYLYRHALEDPAVIDSTLVENGTFRFTGTQDTAIVAAIRFSGEDLTPGRAPAPLNPPFSAIFVLENGNMQVALDQDSYVTGTPDNDDLATFQKDMLATRSEVMPLIEETKSEDPAVVEAAQKKLQQISDTNEKRIKDFLSAHTNSPIGGKLLYDFRHNLKEDERRAIIDRADATFVAAPGVDKIMEHLDILNKVAVGQKFTDFEMEDIQGQMRSLSDYVGKDKIVLIDFWASWCGPCRREMPNLVEAYKKYKNKDFEIVGISLDSSKEAWEKGVKDLNITWPQLSDLAGWKNAGAALYGVNSIPHVLIVDKDGTIISKGLYGEELIKKLQEIFE